jgi:cytochrome c553
MSHISRLALLLAILAPRALLAIEAEFTAEQIAFFEAKVRPLLVERCHECHGAETQEAGLRLDGRAAILRGGDTGPAIVPGKPDQSELIRAVRYDPEGYQMPPDGKLSDEQIAILTRWVESGAPWPSETDVAARSDEAFNLQERAKRWSFQPLRRPAVPPVDEQPAGAWCRNPIDRFIVAKLTENGLTPAEPADRSTLLRRASFDVLGLPPTPQQVAAFVTDDTPGSWERSIEEMLASAHYGERWGRHWLDLVRYAEGRGHEFDHDVANAHQYRDYVIRALNADVPYDQFVVEHVAGDLLVADEETGSPALHPRRLHPQTGANESILGTGFWFLGEWIHSPVDIRADEAERFANMIDVYSKTFLGLTVACARCHDHKFDPITTKDFYALQGYLQSSHYRQARFETMEHNRQVAEASEHLYLEAQRAILPVYQELVDAAVDDLDKYLLAARDVFEGHVARSREPLKSLTAEALQEFVSPIAQLRGLDPVTLLAWVRHLPVAGEDFSNPFHLWGKVCSGELADPGAVQAYLSSQMERERLEEQRVIDEELFLKVGESISVNDADLSILTGFILPLTDTPHHPYRRFEAFVHQRNPLLDDLTPIGDADAEPGAAGHRRSLGATVRSPTFEIWHDKLCARVRGDCSIYVAVDSHMLIKGPLHGQLFSDHPAPEGEDDTWRWITVDVSRYRGHRAHVELLPHAGRSFSLRGVWQRDQDPPIERARLWGRCWSANTSLARFKEFKTLAKTLTSAFRDVECLDPHFVSEADVEETYGCVLDAADWVVMHPELFGLDRPEPRQAIAKVSRPFIEQSRQLKKQVRAASALAPAMTDGSTEVEYVFIRGNWKKPGELVVPAFLEVFRGAEMPVPDRGSGRLGLARWMVEPGTTPILPRVIVNRIWQHYFGVGIVSTPDDFGYMGQDPSHPELLDWLASELVEHDWSLKHIHRLILTSAAYRMASTVDGQSSTVDRTGAPTDSTNHPQSTINPAEVDPTNRLLWRQNVKRLEGEAIRDAVLALSGRFDEQMYGRSIPIHLTPFMEGRGRPAESGPVDGAGRRSIYIAVRRNFPDPFFQAFDMPNPHTTTGRRNVSNVPAQALALMNNPFVIQEAQRWGRRLVRQSSSADQQELIRRAYLACVARAPRDDEVHAAVRFLESQSRELQSDVDDPRVWGDLCHVLLNSKEFVFVR